MSEAGREQRRSVLDWRSWSLPVKLVTIMLVPVVFAVALSVSQIVWQVERADEYERVGEILDAVDEVEPLIARMQTERQRAVELLTGTQDVATYHGEISSVDSSADTVARTFSGTAFDGVVQARYRETRRVLEKLPELRQQVEASVVDVPTAIDGYSTVIGSLLSLDRALNSTVGDRFLSSTATGLQDVVVMMEEVRFQQVWVLYGLSEGSFSSRIMDTLHGSRARLTNKIIDARSTVPQRWQRRLDATVAGDAVVQRNAMLASLLVNPDDFDNSAAEKWNTQSDAVVRLIDDGHKDLAAELRRIAERLRENASDAAGRDSVILLSTLLSAAAIGTIVTRQLLGSLRQLRRSALDSAQEGLPAAVENIRLGNKANTNVDPVPPDTGDEVGQVARAFDEVNRQALRLAIEQTTLRRGYSESFVSVSRRSQSLLERQLLLFEQLEQNEEDPEQLSTLFQLDHLATRMRRNNENLMVLSGSDLVRRFSQPTPLADVLRSGVSEIEQYPRVVVQPPPAVALLGHVASDLVRMFAELFDNAANFSAPDTSVTVSSAVAEDGSVTVDVLDEGIGMGDGELAEANARLTHADENDLASSRRMGLFVAGRLATRHAIDVRLHGGPNVEGVRASVHIPADHVVAQSGTNYVAQTNGFAPDTPSLANGAAQEVLPVSGGEMFESAQTEQFAMPNVDIPQQPRTPSQDFEWSWPSESQPSAGSWFEPIDADGYQWPSGEGERPAPAEPQEAVPTSKENYSSNESYSSNENYRSPEELSRRLAEMYSGVQFGVNGRKPDTAESAWDFTKDEEPENRADAQPSSLTSSGLPRRTPRANLAAGITPDGGRESEHDAPRRDPERLRGRLADFQSGVQRGKHRAPDEEGMQ